MFTKSILLHDLENYISSDEFIFNKTIQASSISSFRHYSSIHHPLLLPRNGHIYLRTSTVFRETAALLTDLTTVVDNKNLFAWISTHEYRSSNPPSV